MNDGPLPDLGVKINEYQDNTAPFGNLPGEHITKGPVLIGRGPLIRRVGITAVATVGLALVSGLRSQPLPQQGESARSVRVPITAPSPGYADQVIKVPSPVQSGPNADLSTEEAPVAAIPATLQPANISTAKSSPTSSATAVPLRSSTPPATTLAEASTTPLPTRSPTDIPQPTDTVRALPTSVSATREPSKPQATATATQENPADQLLAETGIKLQYIREVINDPESAKIYDMNESPADGRLKSLVASILLNLPPEVRSSAGKSIRTIIIARVFPEATFIDPGEIFCMMSQIPAEETTFLLDVLSGPDYISGESERALLSGMQPVDEVTQAVAERAWEIHLTSPEGVGVLDAFLQDNPDWINFSNPGVNKFSELLYFGSGVDSYIGSVGYLGLATRVQSLRAAGQSARVDEAIDLGVLNFTHFPPAR